MVPEDETRIHHWAIQQSSRPAPIGRNTGDKIADGLESAANATEALSDAGIKTGKAGFWLRISSGLARTVSGLFGKR